MPIHHTTNLNPSGYNIGKEEIPEEELLTSSPVKTKTLALQSMCKPAHISKLSYYVTELRKDKGTTTEQGEEPICTPSAAEHCTHHLDWAGQNALIAFLAADISGTPCTIMASPTVFLAPLLSPVLAPSAPPVPTAHQIMHEASPTTLGTMSSTTSTPHTTVLVHNILIGQEVEHTPSPTSSESEDHSYHPHWPRHSAPSAYAIGSNIVDLTHLAASEETMQMISNGPHDIEQSHRQMPPRCENEGEHRASLLKSIDNFKQSTLDWYHSLYNILTDLGFHMDTNTGIFYMQDNGDITLLTIYPEDCLITGTNQELIKAYE